MLSAAQGGELDVDDICDRLSLADIMYELKKLEKESEIEEQAKAVAAAEAEAVADVASVSKKPAAAAVAEEEHKIEDFWTRISGE